ncbi:hypothetical protein TNCV_4330211 [Trichonephila clavipes]|nr:hypothetical protein TNCV_4330211 [Trichonephila clavipes]
MRKKPKTGGAGAPESKPTRIEAGQTQLGAWSVEETRNKTRLVWFTVHECMRNRLKLQEEGEGESLKISAGLVSGGTCILELARKSEVSDSTNSMIWSFDSGSGDSTSDHASEVVNCIINIVSINDRVTRNRVKNYYMIPRRLVNARQREVSVVSQLEPNSSFQMY